MRKLHDERLTGDLREVGIGCRRVLVLLRGLAQANVEIVIEILLRILLSRLALWLAQPARGGAEHRRDSGIATSRHAAGEGSLAAPAAAFAKIRLQSLFMLMTNQPLAVASSYRFCVNVPTLVSGNPIAGP